MVGIVRQAARILGTLMFLMLSLFVIAEGTPAIPHQPGGVQVEFVGIFLMALGFLVGWKWEGWAALSILSGVTIFHVVEEKIGFLGALDAPAIVGVLYGVCWWMQRRLASSAPQPLTARSPGVFRIMGLRLLLVVTAMKQATAATGLAIKIVTGCVLALNAGFYVAAFYQPKLLVTGIVVSVVVLGCYLFWTPVAYKLTDGELTVSFRIGRKRYRPVVGCAAMDVPLRGCVRLCGNGGLFAGSGIFWNRKFGVFRAYVTSCKQADLVLVQTQRTKILISPRDPRGFLVASS